MAQFVHQSADIHSYRADYATAMYKAYARDIKDIPFDKMNRGTGRRYQSEVYTCRKDEAGKKLDKAAMLGAARHLATTVSPWWPTTIFEACKARCCTVSKYVREGLLGNYKEVAGGYSDPECTHVILTLKEYEKILGEKNAANQEKINAIDRANREIRSAKENAAYQIKAEREERKKEIEAVEAELAEAKSEAEHQRELNANLLRIAKERANADRKLRPKKEHTGYVVVSSTEKEYRYKVRRQSESETVMLWETVMQSPYTVDFTEEQTKKLIAGDLTPKDDIWLVGKIGINGSWRGKYENMIDKTASNDEFLQRNIMFPCSMRANFRTGYWEAIFLHTKPLGVVPADMRAK